LAKAAQMRERTFSQTLSKIEDTLFDIHHGTLEEITRLCDCGPAYHIEKFLQVLLIFDKARESLRESPEGQVRVYTIVEVDPGSESED
jgi:hypothetical protein